MKKNILNIDTKKYKKDFQIFKNGVFFNIYSKKYIIPNQGWKIHISATYKNYLCILKKVLVFCTTNHLSFKFINNYNHFILSISKTTDRINFGKFITIYLKNENDFIFYIQKLDKILKKNVGPYIFTDKQYNNNKVLYYRYGVNDLKQGNYLICPNGEKIIDRNIGAKLPYFIKDPFKFSNNNNENNIENSNFFLKNKQYEILGSLFMSTGGGVYLAKNLNDSLVVIKEAIPYVAINKHYSMIKLRNNEIKLLKKLNKCPYIGEFIESFYIQNHFFVVKSFIIGNELNFEAKKYEIFLYKRDNIKILLENFKKLVINFLKLVDFCHKKKIIINDFTMSNFILNQNNDLFLIDLDNSYINNKKNKQKFKINHKGLNEFENNENISNIRLDLHKLGLLLLKIILFGVNYNNIDSSKLKDFEFFTTLMGFYEMDAWVIYLLKDLIFKEKFNLKNSWNYFKKYNFKIKKINNLSSKSKIKNIEVWLQKILKENLKDYFDYINNFKLKINYKKFNIEIFDYLIIVDFENWKNNDFLLNETTKIENCSYIDCTKLKINEIYKIILFNLFNFHLEKKIIYKNSVDSLLNFLIENKIKKVVDGMYVDNSNFFSPNFINGTAGLIYLLILYNKVFISDFYNLKIKEYLDGIDFNFSKKIDFYTGMSGIGFVYIQAYLFFNDKKYKEMAINKTFMINFNKIKKNKIWYFFNEFDNLLDFNFSNGHLGIYFFISNLLKII